ncbi:serine protease [Macrolepiota fuliginosa MF-IS2]|uniref:Serine protease n=1 Tax=Macrolepiota fuliginosa MF-IS2 TaxID=1400762 RepID=A0A9P5XNV1_9AGAR|nr:serine protease [Macrolepiota fuliginosa MF-IS2]
MRFSTAVFTATIFLASSVVAAPSAKPHRHVTKYKGETNGKHIVTLKPAAGVAAADAKKNLTTSHPGITERVEYSHFNFFSAKLTQEAIDALLASDEIEAIEEDGVMSAFTTQTNAPWGLQRISQRTALTSAGVDIYIVDTGIYTAHSQFGGRATWGATFGGYDDADGNGHGTHVSGTAAGSQFGVAKSANLIAVKVLNDAGDGYISDIVSGLNYILNSVSNSGRPSVVSMSLGGDASTSLDSAITTLTSNGIHVVVAAGNSNTDAGSTSPARAASAITVGASTIDDARSSISNYGSVVDVFAPGQDVISSWIGSTTATNNISGTSMATPHVSGLIAYLISLNGNDTPANIANLIKSSAVSGALTGIPFGTANLLIQNF